MLCLFTRDIVRFSVSEIRIGSFVIILSIINFVNDIVMFFVYRDIACPGT